MVFGPFSSGDPAADRRAAFADALAARGDLDAAAEVLGAALDLAPGWAAGWSKLGDLLERAGRLEAAAAAWERALDADPADRFGAGLKRDLARAAPVAETAPPAFVELLFDQYAPRFDAALRGGLAYRGPEIALAALKASGFARAARALDLGCGSGLAGAVLRPFCDVLEGVDISAGMLAEARAKGVYDRLDKADIGALAVSPGRWDLIAAVDVFPYLGALERVIGWCAGSLAPGGRLVFTVEAGEAPLALRESRRFAHSHGHVTALLAEAGFEPPLVESCALRMDRGAPVLGLCAAAARPAARPERESDGEAEAAM